jgi:hypothetical protein
MPIPLHRHGREAASLFDVLGHSEVNATAATEFACSRSPRLAAAISQLVTGTASAVDGVRLEQRTDVGKRTDIEIDTSHARLVIEAKVGY